MSQLCNWLCPKYLTGRHHTHTCGKEVEGGVSGNHPESVMLSAECLDTSSAHSHKEEVNILNFHKT